MFNGLGCNLSTLTRLSNAQSRSICAENPNGEKGGGAKAITGTCVHHAAGLGQGWKVSPSIKIGAGEIYTLADIDGSGAIQHIWMTPTGIRGRQMILRFYWDGNEVPSVECPLGDFLPTLMFLTLTLLVH